MQNIQYVVLSLDPRDRIFIDKSKLKIRTEKWKYLTFSLSKTDLSFLASSLLNTTHFSNQNITKKDESIGKFKAFRLSIHVPSSVKLIGVVMVVSSEVLNLALFSKFAKVTPFDNWGC